MRKFGGMVGRFGMMKIAGFGGMAGEFGIIGV